MENKTTDYFAELISSNRDISINDKIFLEDMIFRYEWFTISKVLLMRYYDQSPEQYEIIKDDISLNLLSCSYFDLQNGTVKEDIKIMPEIKEDMNIIDSFLKKNISKIDMSENQEQYTDIDDLESDEVLEEMADFLAKQKENSQAIEIYTKLSLKFPEKSVYFATVIDKLQERV